MNKTATPTPGRRLTRPLNLNPERRPGIARPFFETPGRLAGHDMLMLSAHPDLIPETAPTPPRDLTFFNLDRP